MTYPQIPMLLMMMLFGAEMPDGPFTQTLKYIFSVQRQTVVVIIMDKHFRA